ncbi:MAG TPA: MBL fold metallo-hydrolase [Dissulfurispiraceae bacterium]|nr:MBL fold metallo-hydrolase [Dissulfurispiraceae bacterium]
MITIKPLASSSRGNAYLLRASSGGPLLLEAGLPFKELRRRIWQEQITIADLSGCLISHEHGDHGRGAADLAAAGVDLYASAGTHGMLKLNTHRAHTIAARQQCQIGPWAVLPFEAIHDAAEPLGFLIAHGAEKLVYATDTAYLPVAFKGLTAIMLECNYSADLLSETRGRHPQIKIRVIRHHLGLDQVKKFLRANDLKAVREIWLIHLSAEHSDAARFKNEIQALTGKPVYIAGERG